MEGLSGGSGELWKPGETQRHGRDERREVKLGVGVTVNQGGGDRGSREMRSGSITQLSWLEQKLLSTLEISLRAPGFRGLQRGWRALVHLARGIRKGQSRELPVCCHLWDASHPV